MNRDSDLRAPIVFFDLDHTLCKVNTSLRFGTYLMYQGLFPFYKIPHLLLFYLLHKANFVSMATLHETVCYDFFRGKSLTSLRQHVEKFLDSELKSMLNTGLLEHLKNAKTLGHHTVLLSSSPDFLVEQIASRLKFNAWAGTEYELAGDRLSGHVARLMDGEDKALYVKDLMKRINIPKEKITAYSDSYLDLPFLEAVGNPVVVNPDSKLRKLSQKRGWKIIPK